MMNKLFLKEQNPTIIRKVTILHIFHIKMIVLLYTYFTSYENPFFLNNICLLNPYLLPTNKKNPSLFLKIHNDILYLKNHCYYQ